MSMMVLVVVVEIYMHTTNSKVLRLQGFSKYTKELLCINIF